MRILLSRLTAAVLSFSGLGVGSAFASPLNDALAAMGPGATSVIVELEAAPAARNHAEARLAGRPLSDAQLQAARDALRADQDRLLADLRAAGVPFRLRTLPLPGPGGELIDLEFRYTLVYNGVNLLVSQSQIPRIRQMPGVKAVHRDTMLWTQLNGSVDYIRAPEVYGPTRELSVGDAAGDGYEGQGTVISVIDTGVDWPHEMFGTNPLLPRFALAPESPAPVTHPKVIYNLPLAEIVVEDGYGHGTHVASTAAGYLGHAPGPDGLYATADDIALHGVAPQARIMSYKVCNDIHSTVYSLTGVSPPTPLAGCPTSATVMSLEDSVSPTTLTGFAKPVADVINMSLGGAGGPDSPSAVASDNASLMGAIVVSSAGNSGPDLATLGAPAAGTRVIAVAASTDPRSAAVWPTDVLARDSVDPEQPGAVVPAEDLPAAENERSSIRVHPMAGTPPPPAGGLAQHYVFVRNGQAPDEFPNSVSGRIALVKTVDRRVPATPFGLVANNAALAGAVAVLFLADTGNATAINAPIPAATIFPEDGDYLIALMTGDPAVNPQDGEISPYPIRIKPDFGDAYQGEVAGFSSRGPVVGLGQVKPDVAAPGVNVLAAVPPASVLGALAVAGGTGANYGSISGTSMASPHVAGAAALIRQAHPDWDPDMVRTAMINTATNARDRNGVPKAEGIDTAHDQGGGLIDVVEAIGARALLGVPGDGLDRPSILGSHSFGERALIDSGCMLSDSVDIELRDLSGAGGSYALAVIDNRELGREGVTAALSASQLSLPAGGRATVQLMLSVDGSKLRDPALSPLDLMGYVEARSSTETLRMPFFSRATLAGLAPVTESFTGTLVAGDNNNLVSEGLTYQDFEFEVGENSFIIDALLESTEIIATGSADLDFFLLDPDGEEIAVSGSPGAQEHIRINVPGPGTYTYRVTGYQNGPIDFEITSTQFVYTGGGSPDCAQSRGDQPTGDIVTSAAAPRGGAMGLFLVLVAMLGFHRRRVRN